MRASLSLVAVLVTAAAAAGLIVGSPAATQVALGSVPSLENEAGAQDCSACLGAQLTLPGAASPGEQAATGLGFTTTGVGATGAEPTLGVTANGQTIFVQASLSTMRSGNSGANWQPIGPVTTGLATFDPVLHYDVAANKLFVNQLTVACTVLAWNPVPTTTPGGLFDTNWKTNPVACGLPVLDHQKLASGPTATLNALNGGRALYLAYSQAGSGGIVARSLDGGVTWTSHPALPVTSRGTVAWPTGPVTPDPAGTYVYLPGHGPSGLLVASSSNEGLTYSVSHVTTTGATHNLDPSVAVDAAGNVYVVWWDSGDKQVKYAYSTNHGASWSSTMAITTPTDYKSTVFPVAVAASSGKMDVAFLATQDSTAGPDGCPNGATTSCRWYLQMAQVTSAASTSPSITKAQVSGATDPVQVGKICTSGTTGCAAGTRNLLDFIDIRVDGSGYAHMAYTDGCTGTCGSTSTGQSSAQAVAYARQTSGTTI